MVATMLMGNRGSFADSAGAAISYLYGRGVRSVAVVYDSTLGDDPVDGVNRALANFSMTAGFVRPPLLLPARARACVCACVVCVCVCVR